MQYAATADVEELIGVGASISMAAVGEPRENGSAERLMRTIKEEEVDLTGYEDFGDASRRIGRSLDEVDDRKRIHSSLGDLTPSEFEQRWISTQGSERSVAPLAATTWWPNFRGALQFRGEGHQDGNVFRSFGIVFVTDPYDSGANG